MGFLQLCGAFKGVLFSTSQRRRKGDVRVRVSSWLDPGAPGFGIPVTAHAQLSCISSWFLGFHGFTLSFRCCSCYAKEAILKYIFLFSKTLMVTFNVLRLKGKWSRNCWILSLFLFTIEIMDFCEIWIHIFAVKVQMQTFSEGFKSVEVSCVTLLEKNKLERKWGCVFLKKGSQGLDFLKMFFRLISPVSDPGSGWSRIWGIQDLGIQNSFWDVKSCLLVPAVPWDEQHVCPGVDISLCVS